MSELTLPYNYEPREYQKPFWDAMMKDHKKRAIMVWHRRAGKDKSAFNYLILQSQLRVGTYYYFLPTYRQAKKIIWDGIDGSGNKFAAHVPEELIASTNETELQWTLHNGSIVQLVGADDKNIDSHMGTNPVGIVYSEYSLMKTSRPWDYMRPILRENGGWAVFIFTARGKNHAHKLLEAVKTNEDWFTQVLTVDDTKRPDGTPVISPEDIEKDRSEGMDEETIESEYYCSFEGSVQGAYFTREMNGMQNDGRIKDVPYMTREVVHTAWDIGVNDATVIWFFQFDGANIRIIDYMEETDRGLDYFAKELRAKPYVYGAHIGPHDITAREWTSGASRTSIASSMGISFLKAPKLLITDGIKSMRAVFPRVLIDAGKCSRGIDALFSYHRKWDDEKQVFSKTPVHDWASNPADAFRTMATAVEGNMVGPEEPGAPRQLEADNKWDPFK